MTHKEEMEMQKYWHGVMIRMDKEKEEAVLVERKWCADIAGRVKKNAWDNLQMCLQEEVSDPNDQAAHELIWETADAVEMGIMGGASVPS
jgi:hypothetical protein